MRACPISLRGTTVVLTLLLASAGLAHGTVYKAVTKTQARKQRTLVMPHGRKAIVVRTDPGQSLWKPAGGMWQGVTAYAEGKRPQTYLHRLPPGSYAVTKGAKVNYLVVRKPAHRTFSAAAGTARTRQIRFSPHETEITLRLPKGASAWTADGSGMLRGLLGRPASNGDHLLRLKPNQTVHVTGGAVLGASVRTVSTLPALD